MKWRVDASIVRMSDQPFATTLDHIPWEVMNSDGTCSATLIGTRDPGVPFTYAFRIPAGLWDGPHTHSSDVHLVVAAGELWLGWGPTATRAAAHAYPAGSLLHVPADAIHADGAGVDTVIYGTAVGPWSTTYI